MYPVAQPNVAIGDPPFSSMILLFKPPLRPGIFQLAMFDYRRVVLHPQRFPLTNQDAVDWCNIFHAWESTFPYISITCITPQLVYSEPGIHRVPGRAKNSERCGLWWGQFVTRQQPPMRRGPELLSVLWGRCWDNPKKNLSCERYDPVIYCPENVWKLETFKIARSLIPRHQLCAQLRLSLEDVGSDHHPGVGSGCNQAKLTYTAVHMGRWWMMMVYLHPM